MRSALESQSEGNGFEVFKKLSLPTKPGDWDWEWEWGYGLGRTFNLAMGVHAFLDEWKDQSPSLHMQKQARQDLEKMHQTALSEVEKALDRSYCPCSGLSVAAGWVLDDGSVAIGVNYESASYGLTLCAERSVIARAQADGAIGYGSVMILAARWKDSADEGDPLTPCGACRQWLFELANRLERDIVVYSFVEGADSGVKMTASELLPDAFGMKNLPRE